MSAAQPRFEDLIGLWQDGGSRLRVLEGRDRTAAERVVDALVDELARRLGGPFTVQEVAALYIEQGTDWCFDVAVRVAPSTPEAWDLTTVAGAAFARYARGAVDYATGRRVTDQRDGET
ncbi:MAG TPA: hypothetical protein VFN65_09535 [Solirubrobacteraceae bacterium]|nr:hypothetical protein [Solirubrobacteraceae bacterium]